MNPVTKASATKEKKATVSGGCSDAIVGRISW